MADDMREQISGLFRGLRKKASDAVAGQEAAFARGKVAGKAVLDDQGGIIVEAGHRIDDSVIERATSAGKLHQLAAAAATAQAQDLREKAQTLYSTTEDGRESHAISSVEDFVRARAYVGRIAVLDVTDIRGGVIVPAGKEITEDDVQRTRDAGQLSALIYSAQQPQPARPEPEPDPFVIPGRQRDAERSYARPKPLPLVPLPEKDEDEIV